MKKTITREKVVQVEENIFVCDLCEKTVEEGSPCIAIKAAIVKSGGSVTLENSPLMVCPDCFPGARLILDTKRIPELRNEVGKKEDERSRLGQTCLSGHDAFSLSQMEDYITKKLSKNGIEI